MSDRNKGRDTERDMDSPRVNTLRGLNRGDSPGDEPPTLDTLETQTLVKKSSVPRLLQQSVTVPPSRVAELLAPAPKREEPKSAGSSGSSETDDPTTFPPERPIPGVGSADALTVIIKGEDDAPTLEQAQASLRTSSSSKWIVLALALLTVGALIAWRIIASQRSDGAPSSTAETAAVSPTPAPPTRSPPAPAVSTSTQISEPTPTVSAKASPSVRSTTPSTAPHVPSAIPAPAPAPSGKPPKTTIY